jgi:hypothetical protein
MVSHQVLQSNITKTRRIVKGVMAGMVILMQAHDPPLILLQAHDSSLMSELGTLPGVSLRGTGAFHHLILVVIMLLRHDSACCNPEVTSFCLTTGFIQVSLKFNANGLVSYLGLRVLRYV